MKKKDKTEETKMGCQKKESSIIKPPSSIPYTQSKSAVMNCVWTVSSAHSRLIPACLGSRMAHHGTKAAHSGAQLAQNGAPMAHTGSRRLTKTSPNPSGWLKKCGLYLLIFEKLNETGLNVR